MTKVPSQKMKFDLNFVPSMDWYEETIYLDIGVAPGKDLENPNQWITKFMIKWKAAENAP